MQCPLRHAAITCHTPGCQMVYFQTKNPCLGIHIMEGLGIDNVDILCGHLKYFTTVWYVSWPFDIFCGHLVNFSRFGMLKKSGNPGHTLLA
jgi:hypothetical protein